MPLHICPGCGHKFRDGDEDADRDQEIAAHVAAWTAQCEERGWLIRGGRISEKHAAELVGMPKRTLEGKRKQGKGPRYAVASVDGSTYSYDLTELAAWDVMRQVGESWKV
jgi:hypothetical protein